LPFFGIGQSVLGMGQQLNAREKRRRRKAYNARKRLAAVEARRVTARKKTASKKEPGATGTH